MLSRKTSEGEIQWPEIWRNQHSLLGTGVCVVRDSIQGLWCEHLRESEGLPAAAWVDVGHRERTEGLLLGEKVTVAKEVFSIRYPNSEISTQILQREHQVPGDSAAPTGTRQGVEPHRLRTKLH